MKEEYKSLFTPWKIGNVEIKNRIVMCPMGGTSLFGWMEPNHFDKVAAEFFLEKARNNVGLIIPGIAPLRDTIMNRWLYKNKKMFRELKDYMVEIHKTGAKLFVQLTAGFGRSFAVTSSLVMLLKHKLIGKIVSPIVNPSYLTASPSVLPLRWKEDVNCRALTIKEIKEMIEAFAKTAKLCKEAGVDGVEIHAVHEGYLLDQFTYGYTNKRTDDYGGSFENRYRFATEVVKEIKKVCGNDYPVSLRYSVLSKTKDFGSGAMPGEDYKEIGRDMIESEKAVKYLEEAGYDMLNCDNGTYDAWYWAHPPAYMPNNCNLEDVAHIKKYVNIPVVCAGRMTLNKASEAIKNNEIDAVGFARQFLVDGKWVTKVINDDLEDIMPCICCHNGCFNMSHYKGSANASPLSDAIHMSRCALNPQTMIGHKYDIKKTKHPKKIAVIGGGIGGMEAARVLTLKGHKVTIFEKSDKLGGVFIPASNFDFKEKDKMLITWFIRQINKLNIEVKFNTEIKSLDELKSFDEIIVAIGAKAKKLRIPGNEKFIDAVNYLSGETVGDRVAIIGGGLTGCEIAYDLERKGKTPIIFEALNDLIVSDSVCLANSSYLRDYFKYKKVEVHLESKVKGYNDGYIEYINKDGKEEKVAVDSVISSIGYTPLNTFKKKRKVHIIGDALKVGNLRTVIWGVWDVCKKIK